jgi:glycosyltransferase involved in cell wall biosynthesis
MAGELLSICIPTYNRAQLLKSLLETLDGQIQSAVPSDVVIYVSDNCSTDATPEVAAEFQKRPGGRFVYSRNSENIGLSRNLLKVLGLGKGRFIWTLGDDEVVSPDAVMNIVKDLGRHDPGLMIMFDTRYLLPVPKPGVYADYREFARACIRLNNVHALAQHVLLSSNIYRAEFFDADLAMANLDTWLPHMYGMLRPLLKHSLPVLIPDYQAISTRDDGRGAPADGIWADLDQCCTTYLQWLREEMQVPELDPFDFGRTARRMMWAKFRSDPVDYISQNWRAMFQPSAYRYLFTRFFGARKVDSHEPKAKPLQHASSSAPEKLAATKHD